MKILLCSYSGYGAWFTLRLLEEGHSVDYWLMDKKFASVLQGIVPSPFFDRPDFSKYDLVLFDLTGKPKIAEQALLEAPTIGDGDLQTQLEDDRLFGIEVMEQCDINVPFYEVFDSLGEARRFIKKTGKRYVFKPNGGQDQDTASTYVSESAEDLLKYLDKLEQVTHGVEFVLQEVIENGTEVSTEAWFNGNDFYFINGTLEEKKLMNDRKGPNTGCSGNLVWTYEQPPFVFREGLGKLKDFLQEYNYRGMVDLNTIVTSNELYGLEWTPRFGYDASPTLFALLQRPSLGDFLRQIAIGDIPTTVSAGLFAAGVRLSIPPYPSEIKGKHPDGIPIQGIDPEKDNICHNYYLYDAMVDDSGELVTAGISGFICVPMAVGNTIHEAFARVNEMIKRIKIPDMQYRTDIEHCTKCRYDVLSAQGWL